MMIMLCRAAFALCLLASALPAFGDSGTTRLRIEVQNLQGKPIERASVIVNFVEGRSVVKLGKKNVTQWEVRTNQEGVAKVPAIPEGKVRIQVIAKGYQTFGETFEVADEEKTIAIKLNPPQPQFSAH